MAIEKKKNSKKRTMNVVLDQYKNKLKMFNQDLPGLLSILLYRDIVAKEFEEDYLNPIYTRSIL